MTAFPATEAIVDFVHAYDRAAESPAAVERAKLLVLDLVGVAIAGAYTEDAAALAEIVGQVDGGATLMGSELRAGPRDAALVNGFAGHLLEFDDATLNPVGHPSVIILPAVLALAEVRGLGGDQLLTAYLVGLEVHSRLGLAKAGNWSHLDQWLPLGHIGLMGAAAAAARLMGLSPEATAHCLGFAANTACQLNVSNGTSAKSLGAGHSARLAVEAAELAEAGLTSAARVIERPGGFAETFLGADAAALEAALSPLGGPSHLEEVGLAIKRYPSCYGSHWSVDALRDLLEEHDLAGDEIARVELAYPPDAAFLDDPEPSTVDAARFSLQYGLAMCLLDGHPTLESFEPARLDDPRTAAALTRVRARTHPPETEPPLAWTHVVTVTTVAGDRFTGSVRRPRGHPRDPATPGEVLEKFLLNARPIGDQAGRVAALVQDLERHPARELAALLAGGTEPRDDGRPVGAHPAQGRQTSL